MPAIAAEKLWIENGAGAARAHRVIQRSAPYKAPIGGKRRVVVDVRLAEGFGQQDFPVLAGELVEAAPLTDAEEAEYQRLDAKLAGTIGEARVWERFNALRLRWLMFGGPAGA